MEDLLVKSKFSDTEEIKNPSLDRLSCSELNILLGRQHKLLSNSTIVNNLADKGDKIRLYISTLEAAIQVRGNFEETLQAISELKIEETESPLHSPQANSPKVRSCLTDVTDNEKLDKVRDKLASRPALRSTQLLIGSDLQELVERERGRDESRKQAEIRLGDFMGMFKVGNVKVTPHTDDTGEIFIRDSDLREEIKTGLDADTDSELSDHTDTSSTGIGDIGDGIGLYDELSTT